LPQRCARARFHGQTLDEFLAEAIAKQLKEAQERTSAPASLNGKAETILELALERARAKETGERFTVRELFSRDEWQGFSSGVRKTLGKNFRRDVEDGRSPIARHVGPKRNESGHLLTRLRCS